MEEETITNKFEVGEFGSGIRRNSEILRFFDFNSGDFPKRKSSLIYLNSGDFPKCESSLIYHIDCANYLPCLLYTSPSPRDRTRSRMPSSA